MPHKGCRRPEQHPVLLQSMTVNLVFDYLCRKTLLHIISAAACITDYHDNTYKSYLLPNLLYFESAFFMLLLIWCVTDIHTN